MACDPRSLGACIGTCMHTNMIARACLHTHINTEEAFSYMNLVTQMVERKIHGNATVESHSHLRGRGHKRSF